MKKDELNLDELFGDANTELTQGPDIDCDSGQGDRIMLKRPFRLDEDDSDLFSSQTKGSKNIHYPIFDFDFPVTVIPSRTPGHFHVILQKEVTTASYQAILDVFAAAGLVQAAWADRLLNYGAIFLRFPAFFKELIHRGRIIYGKGKEK